MTREFKQYAINMNIIVINVPVKTHHLIDMIERYHESLKRIYEIIIFEILDIAFDLILQMSFKAINDFVGPNDLISTLLVFDVYFRMIELNSPSSLIIQWIMIMKKIMNEIRKTNAIKQVNNVLNTRNNPSIELIHDLALNSRVLLFRENNIDQSKQ